MKIKVKGRAYDCWVVESIDGGRLAGKTNIRDKNIYITKDEQSIEDTLQTVIHELTHAYFYECGLKRQCDDEELVEWFEINFLQMLNSFLEMTALVYPESKKTVETIKDKINCIVSGKDKRRKTK